MYICVDFDGTCVTHAYPHIGEDIGAVPVLQKLAVTNKLILFTMRSGKELQDAVDWFDENNIELFGVNVNPTQHHWTTSPKAYGNIYIDDAAFGCPLIRPVDEAGRPVAIPYVNWKIVNDYFFDEK